MTNLSKYKKILNKVNKELSSKLLFYNEFINIDDYKVQIIDPKDYDEKDVDCINNILYIDKTTIDFISLESIFKHKLIHSYLYHITDINLRRLSIDTSYLFILYCIATDTDIGYIAKDTIYYNNALKMQSLIKNRPYLIDFMYISLNKKEKDIINNLAEIEWFRINNKSKLFYDNYIYKELNTIESINHKIGLNSELGLLDFNIFSSRFEKENA